MSGGFQIGAAKAVVEREDDGRVVHINDETGEPMYFNGDQPVTMTVAGSYSARYRRAEEAVSDRRIKLGKKGFGADRLRRDRIEVAAACVRAWAGFFEDGQLIECQKQKVIAVLREAPWIADQVEAAIEDHASFFENASTT